MRSSTRSPARAVHQQQRVASLLLPPLRPCPALRCSALPLYDSVWLTSKLRSELTLTLQLELVGTGRQCASRVSARRLYRFRYHRDGRPCISSAMAVFRQGDRPPPGCLPACCLVTKFNPECCFCDVQLPPCQCPRAKSQRLRPGSGDVLSCHSAFSHFLPLLWLSPLRAQPASLGHPNAAAANEAHGNNNTVAPHSLLSGSESVSLPCLYVSSSHSAATQSPSIPRLPSLLHGTPSALTIPTNTIHILCLCLHHLQYLTFFSLIRLATVSFFFWPNSSGSHIRYHFITDNNTLLRRS